MHSVIDLISNPSGHVFTPVSSKSTSILETLQTQKICVNICNIWVGFCVKSLISYILQSNISFLINYLRQCILCQSLLATTLLVWTRSFLFVGPKIKKTFFKNKYRTKLIQFLYVTIIYVFKCANLQRNLFSSESDVESSAKALSAMKWTNFCLK